MADPLISSATPTAKPAVGDSGYKLDSFDTLRVTFQYDGTVTTAEVLWWIKTSAGWAVGLSTEDDAALEPVTTPEFSTGVKREVRDYAFGSPSRVWPQIVAITGGGALSIYVDGTSLEV